VESTQRWRLGGINTGVAFVGFVNIFMNDLIVSLCCSGHVDHEEQAELHSFECENAGRREMWKGMSTLGDDRRIGW